MEINHDIFANLKAGFFQTVFKALTCTVKCHVIRKLNKLGGENGIGLLDIVENRLVGMKDRGVYETPGGTILYKAHQCLEMITIDKDTAHMKSKLAVDFADLVYNGKWFTPLREALSAFADKTQESTSPAA